MAIKLHGHHFSTATGMVLCCLNEKEVEYEFVTVGLSAGAHKQPQYLALNQHIISSFLFITFSFCCFLLVLPPFGKVPKIQDGDFTLFESRAIVKYLAKKYKGQGTDLLGNTLAEESLVEQWCQVEGQSFFSPASTIFYQTILFPMRGGATDAAVVEANIGKLNKVVDIYEKRLSKSKYLAGDFFSLADLQHLPWTHYLVTACRKGDLVSSRKLVNAWWEDISSRPAWKKVSEKMPK